MKRLYTNMLMLSSFAALTAQPAYDFSKLQMEKLNRGVVAFRQDADTVCVSWRYLPQDATTVAFDVYRDGKKINREPLRNRTFLKDACADAVAHRYEVRVVGQQSPAGEWSMPADAPTGYLNIPLDVPAPGVTPDGQSYRYFPNDASIGDVNGDGQYEIILKWDPSNAHDNAHDGYTGPVYFDCYTLTGQKLWRIDMGRNIRAGAHYTQFMVYDLDGDNKAEIVMKTSDSTIDGTGKVIGDAAADYCEKNGRILTGNEFLTVFNGETGAAMQTIDYVPGRGNMAAWGDTRGNRCERYLAAIAYLDGIHPSVVMCRGYYTRAVLAAFDWREGRLSQRWVFDSDTPGNEGYAGQGFHNLRVGDVDGDGCDEIVYGSCTINNNGQGLFTTRQGHGDAMHLTGFDPSTNELQYWCCHENHKDGSTLKDAKTGKMRFQIPSPIDVGRAMAADIDPTHYGVEMWSLESQGIRNLKGEVITPDMSTFSCNSAVWWTGDLLRELLDRNHISKYDWKEQRCHEIFRAEGARSISGTKATPVLQGDLIGDWREEVILPAEDGQSLRLYITPYATEYRFHTFLTDPAYRISIATQNVAYNQPTQPGFYFGPDLKGWFRGTNLGN